MAPNKLLNFAGSEVPRICLPRPVKSAARLHVVRQLNMQYVILLFTIPIFSGDNMADDHNIGNKFRITKVARTS